LSVVGRFVGEALGPFSFREVRLRRPDRTFRGELALEVGGREVRLIEVGPAHTPGDLIVHVPDARVVFAGDILFIGVTPVMWAGPVERRRDRRARLRRVAAPRARADQRAHDRRPPPPRGHRLRHPSSRAGGRPRRARDRGRVHPHGAPGPRP
jgi:glyoxylase-like metal-dependent hydrolase (beta-lactamase superfamily II)